MLNLNHVETGMQLKERIQYSVNQLDNTELILVYEYLQWLNHLKQTAKNQSKHQPIEEILELTSSSKSSWADTVIQQRAESP